MNTIDAYILRKRFVEASDCLQKFSKLIRRILENSENSTISLHDELETLVLYVELEQERFSDSFDLDLDVESELSEQSYQVPPLVIQPFVENAILHGMRNLKERKGHLVVRLFQDKDKGGQIVCSISDNGIGLRASHELGVKNELKQKSMGMDITVERITAFQKLYGLTPGVTITELREGVNVEFRLPRVLI